MISGKTTITVAVIGMIAVGTGIGLMRAAGAAPPAPAAAAGGNAATPTGDWQGGPLGDKEGKFAYCVIENRYNNGRALSIARNSKGEFAMVVAQPGGKLPAGKATPITLKVDKLDRQRTGNFRNAELLEIPMGPDEEFFTALGKSKNLVVTGPTDALTFSLKGVGKALTALKECATLAAAGKPVPPMGGAKPPQAAGGAGAPSGGGPVPRDLATVLKAAGMGAVVPAGGGGANQVWGFGPLVGVVEEVKVKPGTAIEELAMAFTDGIKKRCRGETEIEFSSTETVGKGSLKKGEAKCTGDKQNVHLALLIHLQAPDTVFIFTHESDEEHRSAANDARDRMLETIRKVASGK